MDTVLRAVMVGCGGMSKAWLSAAQKIPNLEVVGFVDLNEESAKAKSAEFGTAESVVGTDLATVLNETAPDMVFDCTVPEAHFNVTLTALKHGCHVLGEKPLADTLEHAQQMVAAADTAGKLYAVIQNRRYDPNIRRLKHFLASGAMGEITTINSDFYIAPHFGGFRDAMQHVLLLDMAIHTFDAARYLCGADPVSVYCKEWNPNGSWYAHGASAVAIFEMSSGAVYTYRGSWCAEGLPTTWESDWRIVGAKGTALWHGGAQMKAQCAAKTGGFFSEHEDAAIPSDGDYGRVGGHAGLIAEFVDCVRMGQHPETICSDNIKSLAMVLAAIESTEKGQTVEVRWK